MSATWYGDAAPPNPRVLKPIDWLRVIIKGSAVGILVFGGLVLTLILRVLERPVFHDTRPITSWITVIVCRGTLRLMGIKRVKTGAFDHKAQAIVANHASWLDIFVLNSLGPMYFVSKAEVAGWPGIGWLARATGTVFIARDRTQAQQQRKMFLQRLAAGHRLLFFPEGTSSDGLRVLPFKSTLFAALFDADLDAIAVQPVSVRYAPPEHEDRRFYGWWGGMEFGPHLVQVLAFGTGGNVVVRCHEKLHVAELNTRKDLAQRCELQVRDGHGTAEAHPSPITGD